MSSSLGTATWYVPRSRSYPSFPSPIPPSALGGFTSRSHRSAALILSSGSIATSARRSAISAGELSQNVVSIFHRALSLFVADLYPPMPWRLR